MNNIIKYVMFVLLIIVLLFWAYVILVVNLMYPILYLFKKLDEFGISEHDIVTDLKS